MFVRLAILFLPSLLGLLWKDDPAPSIAWSLAGSLYIAGIAQTRWFRQEEGDIPVTHRLLRPVFTYHLFFVLANVVGGAFYALDSPFGDA